MKAAGVKKWARCLLANFNVMYVSHALACKSIFGGGGIDHDKENKLRQALACIMYVYIHICLDFFLKVFGKRGVRCVHPGKRKFCMPKKRKLSGGSFVRVVKPMRIVGMDRGCLRGV